MISVIYKHPVNVGHTLKVGNDLFTKVKFIGTRSDAKKAGVYEIPTNDGRKKVINSGEKRYWSASRDLPAGLQFSEEQWFAKLTLTSSNRGNMEEWETFTFKDGTVWDWTNKGPERPLIIQERNPYFETLGETKIFLYRMGREWLYLGYENYPYRRTMKDDELNELVLTFQKNIMPFILGCRFRSEPPQGPETIEHFNQIGDVYYILPRNIPIMNSTKHNYENRWELPNDSVPDRKFRHVKPEDTITKVKASETYNVFKKILR
jgi:hypothetical protein